MILGKSRRSTWLSQRYIMNQVSAFSSLAGLLFIAGIKKTRPLKYKLRGRIRLFISLWQFHMQYYPLHLTSFHCLLLKLLLGTSKNQWEGSWLVRHLKPEIFWVYSISGAAWLRTCSISQCKSFVLKTFFPCADFQRIWRLSSWSAFDLCRTSRTHRWQRC